MFNKLMGYRSNPEKPSVPAFSGNHVKCFVFTTEKKLKVYEEFVARLKTETAGLQSVSTVQESDFILAFCIVMSNQESAIKTFLQSLQSIPETKPVVLVVLHHTFNKEHYVTDNKRYVNEKVTVTVDCLFHEDKLLPCLKNNESQDKITDFIKKLKNGEMVPIKPHSKHDRNVFNDPKVGSKKIKTEPPPVCENKTSKCLVFPIGETQNVHEIFIEQLKQKRNIGLEKALLVEDCDFLLSFYTVVTRKKTQINAVLKMLHELSAGKPTALVVLHRTEDPDLHVPDSSEAGKDLNITIVDCLFFNNTLLNCQRNKDALAKIIQFTNSQDQQNQNQIPNAANTAGKPVNCYIFQTADKLNSSMTLDHIKRQIPNLQQVNKEDECDYIIGFCPFVSRHEVDIVSAVQKLNQFSDTKPAALVLLHTFNPDQVVPDSSSIVNRGNLLAVDCLFNGTCGLLPSHKNDEALTKIKQDIQILLQKRHQPAVKPVKFFSLTTAGTLRFDAILDTIKKKIPNLREVSQVDECDYIMGFCPVVSRAGTDIQSALQKLNQTSGNKPVALVVLHHTFDPEHVVPDSSRAVNRENLIVVDCLFYEGLGLLQCQKNLKALTKIQEYTNLFQIRQQPAVERMKYYSFNAGDILNVEAILDNIERQLPNLLRVFVVDECDYIICFCPVVTQAGTDITSALQKLNQISGSKPAALVVLHHTFNPEQVVPDTSRAVNRENLIAVDFLLNEDCKLLCCQRNNEALTKIQKYITPVEKGQSIMPFFISGIGSSMKQTFGFPISTDSAGTSSPISTKKVFDLIFDSYPGYKQKDKKKDLISAVKWRPGVSGQHPKRSPLEGHEEPHRDPKKQGVKCYIQLTGKTLKADEHFMEQLIKAIPDLQKVNTEQKSDFILVFCPVVSQHEHNLKEAVHLIADSKPAAVVVLHHTFDKDRVVPDSSRFIGRKNVIAVDCLFHEDSGLLQCQKNRESLSKVTDFIQQVVQSQKQQSTTEASPLQSPKNEPYMKTQVAQQKANKKINYLVFPMGETQNVHEKFIDQLNEIINLQKCYMVEDCDFLLSFYTSVTRNETTINSVLTMLQELSAGKPTALVVLHHKYSDFSVADSSKAVKRQTNMIAVDYLINDQKPFICQNNDDVLAKIINFIQDKCNTIDEKMETEEPLKTVMKPLKFYLKKCTDKNIIANLTAMMPNLHQVFTVEQSDFILVFCPVGPAGVDIKLEMEMLHHTPDTKPTIMMVLHHTDFIVPDSSKAVSSKNAWVVDCLFHDEGLLQCRQNDESLTKIKNTIQRQCQRNQTRNKSMGTDVQFLVYKSGNILNIDETITDRLKAQIPGLHEVQYVELCDFILGFCPVDPQAGTDIEMELQLLHNISDTKPIFLVMLHHTDSIIPESRAVNRENAFAVDCLVDAQGLLQCHENKKSLAKIVNFLQCQMYV